MEYAYSYIAGRRYQRDGLALAPVVNPADGETIGQVEMIDATGLDEALAAAADGFETWRKTSPYERARIMQDAVTLLRERKEAIGRLMTLEQGKPLAEAIGEVATAADNTEWMAQEATRAYGRLLSPRTFDVMQVVKREPIGPVASFCPWNFPALTPARKIAGALAAGCSVILKPSEETPFTAREIVQAFIDAGVPAGVLNLVYGQASDVSAHLIASPVVRKISFTGSTRVGKELLALAAQGVKRATMELGGHGRVIALDDGDPVGAARQAVAAKFRNAGQTCVCANRIYAQDGIYEAFVAKLAEKAKALRVGNGFEDGVQQGPLIDDNAIAKVERHVADAVGKGARVLTGGKRLQGRFFEPTVLADVTPDMLCSREETFGPVAPVIRFRTEEEVIALANDTEFGLASYFYSRDIGRIFRVGEALEYGMVGINTGLVAVAEVPFGGVKQSGLGREGSHHGMDDYVEIKYLCLGDIQK